jgi:hypothetical protein
MNDNNNQNNSSGSSVEPEGKVLPFRKPAAIQPTLRRSAGGTHIQHKQPPTSRKDKSIPAWKAQAARGLQVALLLAALLLALKNCGKI